MRRGKEDRAMTSPTDFARRAGAIALLAAMLVAPACADGPSEAADSPGGGAASSREEQGLGSAATQPGEGSPQDEVVQLDSYTIADTTGDWGYPAPYSHYSRGPGYVRMQYLFETLVWKNADEFIPQLASDWEYVAEDNAYVFTLRDDVKWHDGTDFTADDVVFTYNYTQQHPYTWIDNSIVASAEALDAYTVKLYLNRPYAPFFQDVAGSQPILPRHIWEGVDVPEEFQAPEAAIGTGPYRLVDYSKEHGTYLYEANEDYYLGTPAARQLKFVKVSAEMATAALLDHQVDSTTIPAEVVDAVKAAGFTVINAPVSSNAKLTINHRKEPLSSKEFRQALAYAIDREALVQTVMRGQAIAGSPGMVPPTSVWYNPDTPQFEYDPERARELIEGLGYTFDEAQGIFVKDGAPLQLSLIAAATYKDLGQFIMQQLEQAGIGIDFQTLESKTVDSKVIAWDFDLSLYGHGGLYEPSFLTRSTLDEDNFNSARYTADPDLTHVLQDQLTEMDPARRKDLVFEAQVLYAEDVPALSLYYPESYWADDGSIPLYYTMDGISVGVPIPLNRMCFVIPEEN
jgi:peptide/nickel transport system substrate-binding protein